MDAYVGEIRLVAFNYPMEQWSVCDGSKLLIKNYRHLFSVIGNTYGGDGINDFRLPKIDNQIMVGAGTGPGLPTYDLGEDGGMAAVTLSMSQMPAHDHPGNFDPSGGTAPVVTASFLAASAIPSTNVPSGSSLTTAIQGGNPIFADAPGTNPTPIALVSGTIVPGTVSGATLPKVSDTGSNRPISVIPPYQTLLYVICLYGFYPPRPA